MFEENPFGALDQPSFAHTALSAVGRVDPEVTITTFQPGPRIESSVPLQLSHLAATNDTTTGEPTAYTQPTLLSIGLTVRFLLVSIHHNTINSQLPPGARADNLSQSTHQTKYLSTAFDRLWWI